MAEISHSTKRRRISTTHKSTIVILEPGESRKSAKGQETFTRDADFWLEDGNLILLAATTAFRFYRGILIKKSTVFAEMFDSGSLDATKTFDGCPIVHLSDHPEDLRDFLQHLTPCSELPLFEGTPTPRPSFEQLHAAFHLAHKYQCPYVEACALSALKKFYTASFTQYVSFDEVEHRSLRHPHPQAAIAAVIIARLTHTPSMLPYALYLTATREGDMLDGYTRRDGSVEHLSAADLRLCINARGALAREHVDFVSSVFGLDVPSAVGCKTPRACPAAREGILAAMELNAPGAFDVLHSYVECIEEWAGLHKLCSFCTRAMLDREMRERRRVWEMLPQIFDLDAAECGFAASSSGADGSG